MFYRVAGVKNLNEAAGLRRTPAGCANRRQRILSGKVRHSSTMACRRKIESPGASCSTTELATGDAPSRNGPGAWTPSAYYRFVLSVSQSRFLSTDFERPFWKRFGKEPYLGFPMDLTNLPALRNDQKAGSGSFDTGSGSELTSLQLAFRLPSTPSPLRVGAILVPGPCTKTGPRDSCD